MQERNHQPPRTQRRFGTPWGELDYVCKRIHYWLYDRKSLGSARRYLSRLERILKKLPANELAILREEAKALLHELQGQKSEAIEHRQREIELTERLRKSVSRSVQAGDYDERMAASILARHDDAALEGRRLILRNLQETPESSRSRPKHSRPPRSLTHRSLTAR